MARKAAANIDPQAKPPEPTPKLTEPVEVTIEPEAETAAATEVAATPDPAAIPGTTEIERPDQAAPPAVAPPPPQEDPEKVTLRQRLQEMENADRLNKQAIEEANKKVREAHQQRSEAARREFDAQMDSINNSIGAANSIIESGESELEAAQAAGDAKAVSTIIGKLSRSHAQLERLEYQKGLMEQRLEQAKRQPQQQQPQRQQQPQPQQPQPQPQRPMTVEEVISGAPVPDRAKNWLRQHPEYVSDPAKNRLIQSAHDIAAHKAAGEFNDAYFEHLETMLGIQPAKRNGSAGAPLVSAPPTRETPSMTTGAPRSTKITLTPEQREVAQQIANSRDITQAEAERIYAKELMDIKKREGK